MGTPSIKKGLLRGKKFLEGCIQIIIVMWPDGWGFSTAQAWGGLVASNYGTILDCHASGNVEGETSTGGLIGANSGVNDADGIVRNSYSTGQVRGYEYVGGLIGLNTQYALTSDCYSTGSVEGTNRIGGLIGYNTNSANVYDSYATGDVRGDSDLGGLIGFKNSGEVLRCYSTGTVQKN